MSRLVPASRQQVCLPEPLGSPLSPALGGTSFWLPFPLCLDCRCIATARPSSPSRSWRLPFRRSARARRRRRTVPRRCAGNCPRDRTRHSRRRRLESGAAQLQSLQMHSRRPNAGKRHLKSTKDLDNKQGNIVHNSRPSIKGLLACMAIVSIECAIIMLSIRCRNFMLGLIAVSMMPAIIGGIVGYFLFGMRGALSSAVIASIIGAIAAFYVDIELFRWLPSPAP